ncbi:GntR family transcriptional regulator [Pseudoroseomonas ludipueritiae]|uniref:GntR family transcriptional regulator n=1 Tax=Pseudoroseomonas ludipueritiae TaxID=198093 RepID=A0ABR7RAT8_9PROT|nr:GntR family transcriptional regulator [Pseudoroseomonas ludipueritiae]MBC9178818.1 GntR family transcriptional regulator [Pseudoroseomonas ludipueritiae]
MTRLVEAPPRWRTATEYVEATLKAAILEGRIPAGTPLRQDDIARDLDVSRMPVREALRRLEAQALVDAVPHKGAVVTDISAADAADSFAIRQGLEEVALRLSIPHLTAEDLARAGALIEAMEVEPDAGQLGQLNRRFHMALYARAGRPRLLLLLDRELAVFDRYLRFFLAARGRGGMAQDDHRALLEAARAGDAEAAVAVLARHIETAARGMAEFFAGRAAGG